MPDDDGGIGLNQAMRRRAIGDDASIAWRVIAKSSSKYSWVGRLTGPAVVDYHLRDSCEILHKRADKTTRVARRG